MKKNKWMLGLLGLAVTGMLSVTGCTNAAAADTNEKFDTTRMINVVSREDGSGTRGAFIELFGVQEKGADGTKVDRTTKEAVVANKTDVMLTTIATDPYAIGYVSLGSLNETVKAMSIDGTAPTVENAKSGKYKITRPFHVATKGEASGAAKDFINYMMSTEGQQIITDNGYLSVNDQSVSYMAMDVEGKVVVAGSSSVAPVMEKLAEAYQAANGKVTVEVQQSDSTAGMTAAMEGTCDIGMASRDLKDSEKATLTSTVIANDGIAVITSVKNPLNDLTSAQVKDIFTGSITTWNGLS